MKKCILTAVIFLAMSGFAAAQTTKEQEKTQKPATQKSTDKKTSTKKQGSTHTTATVAQVELPAKIRITLPAVDTTGVPVKNKQ
jgi:hypothetical protein